MTKLNEIKKYLKKQPKLKLKGLNKPEEKTPEEFLLAFFKKYNKNLDTVYKNNGTLQCLPNKRRSIQDIYLIVSNYYPKASLTKLYTRLLTLIANGEIVSSICKDIYKRVYRVKSSSEESFLNGTLTDEFGIDLKIFKGIDKVGITTKCNHNKEFGWGQNYTREHLKIIEI